jgi:DNA-binding NarL/FixJ family response regulator
MRVLIADERSSVRAALRAVLERDPQCEGIDEASDAGGALAALGFGANVVLLEWGLRGLPAEMFLRIARARRPGIVVVVLGRYAEARPAALAAGADYYVDTSEPAVDFIGLLHQLSPEWRQAINGE